MMGIGQQGSKSEVQNMSLNRLFVTSLKSVGLVSAGDNPDAEVVIFKARVDKRTPAEKLLSRFDELNKRKFTAEQRRDLAESGKALKDGSFPIVNTGDLRNAISAFGRAGAKTAVKAHIIRRAKALGATDMLPDKWNVSKLSVKAESLHDSQKVNMDLSAIKDDQLRKSIEDAFAEKDTEVSDLETNLEKAIEKVAELEKGESKPEDDASDEVKGLIKERDDQISGLRKDLDDAVTKAREAEYVVKAEPFQRLLGKPDEVGVVFADLAVKAPESFTKLEGMLNAAAQREDLAKLFATMGAGEGEGESDPIDKREAWVEKNKKDDETVTQARGRYWTEHPDAVKDSRS